MVATTPAADQVAIIALLAGMLAIFSLERFRLEVVALAGLAVGYLLGLVPAASLFSGFANPAVVTVVEVLIIAGVLGKARILDPLVQPILRFARTEGQLIAALCLVSALISVFMNNIGAFALVLPILFHLSDARGISRRKLLIPVSYATLLGGTCSVVGTPANLIVSVANQETQGQPLGFFSFAYVGLPLAVIGLIVVVLWIPRIFDGDEPSAGDQDERIMLTELNVTETSSLVGVSLTAVEEERDLDIHSVFRGGRHVFQRRRDIVLQGGDLVVAKCRYGTIFDMIEKGDLAYPGEMTLNAPIREAVVMPESTLIGSSVHTLEVFRSRAVGIVGLGTRSSRIEGRLADQRIAIGDILYLSGDQKGVAEALRESESLQIWRPDGEPRPRPSFLAPAIFAFGVFLTSIGIVPPEIGFGLVLLTLLLFGRLDLRHAFAELNWPIIIMLASLIPLSTAVETTGAAASIARWMVVLAPFESPETAVALVLLLSFVLTPFINNASAALVLVPVASEMARQFGCPLEALLYAIAVGVSIDFLTPVGHHNNTIAMGIGVYRFSDFPRAGWPVSCATLATAYFAIVVVWI